MEMYPLHEAPQKAFMKNYTRQLFFGTNVRSVWPNAQGVSDMMMSTGMTTMDKTDAKARLLLAPPAAFPSRVRSSENMKEPGKVLRAAVPHLMTEVKKISAREFYEMYHSIKKVGTIVKSRGKGKIVFGTNACFQFLWNNTFFTTLPGRLSMQAVVHAAVSKWATLQDVLVPASARVSEPSYRFLHFCTSCLSPRYEPHCLLRVCGGVAGTVSNAFFAGSLRIVGPGRALHDHNPCAHCFFIVPSSA